MKKRDKSLLSLLLSLALIISLGSGYFPGRQAKAEEGNFENLNQQEIVQAMGAGWNLGNQLEANLNGTPKEGGWTNVMITEKLIRSVKTNGFKSIRIPVSWLSKIGNGPDYTIDQAWMDRVQEVVDWAIKYKLYVIINIHGDGYSTVQGGWILPGAEDQESICTKYEAVWKQIAERFKDYDQHLIFESMNEVGADFSKEEDVKKATENINAYNQIFVDTVRKSGGNNDKRWLLIPGCNTNIAYTTESSYGFQIPEDNYRSTEIPEEEKRIMISVHYYTPWEFCGQDDYKQTQWGPEADPSKSVGYGGEDEMEKQFKSLKTTFTDKGYPVVIGEYGSVDKTKKEDSGIGKAGDPDPTNNEYRAYFAWKLCKLSIQNGCVPIYWDNGWNGDLGFAIFSRATSKDKELGFRTAGLVTQPEILSSIVSCYGLEKGDATAITLNKTMLTMDLADGSQQLEAALTPADAGDTITWESSDTSVASVSYKGKVTPKGIGTCLITATVPNGPSAYCIVKVTPPQSFKGGLYGMVSSWSQLECKDYLTVAENGYGEYTITLSGEKNLFQPIRTLFIKDVTVQRGVAKESCLKSATFVIDSLKFNETELEMTQREFFYDKKNTTDGVLDICLINAWAEEVTFVSGLTKGDQGYNFPADAYVEGTNTITMKLQIKDAVLDISGQQSETEVSTLELAQKEMTVEAGKTASAAAIVTPQDATEKILWFSENQKVAKVSQDGVVTGVKGGETTIHALTASGLDAVCKVTVSGDTLVTEEPSLPPLDGTEEPISTEQPEPTEQATQKPTQKPEDPVQTPGSDPAGNTPAPVQNPSVQTPAPSQTQEPSAGDADTKKLKVKKVTIKKVSSKKKKVLVQWKKLSGVTGYQIQSGSNKKLTKDRKSVTVKKAKTTRAIIKKLKSKKTYYVRVRAYKTVKGKKYYGSWSKVLRVKVK